MKKGLKIALYCLLIIAIIAVVFLMLGLPKQENIESDTDSQVSIWNETTDIEESEPTFNTDSPNTDEDVMKDLEGFFGDSNGYENIEGEYGFTNIEIE